MAWHYKQRGTGRPLILLHGIGMSSNAWKPVMPILAAQRRVIAFDLPGFGRTPPLPAGTPPTAENIVRSLQDSLHEMGIDEPVDFAGNSLGGYFAMEAARRGLARSVVALSPGGLWERDASAHVKPLFRIMRKGLQAFPLLGEALVLLPPLRMMLMAVPMTSQGWKIPARDAIVSLRNFARAPGFDDTLEAVEPFRDGRKITCPLTVAFGDRDWLLTAASQNRGELPAHTRWLKPRGWGHVPMWDDPKGVAQLIIEGTR
jgi:pimeloyl-ACP methyl ester carboxylesterase